MASRRPPSAPPQWSRVWLLAALLACGEDAVGPGPAPQVIVTPAFVDLALGASRQLGVTVLDENGQTVVDPPLEFTSSDAARVAVTPSGLMTAQSPGEVTVTVTSGAARAYASVRAISPATLRLSPDTASVQLGDTKQGEELLDLLQHLRGPESLNPDPALPLKRLIAELSLQAGDVVTASIDWDLRHAHMRCHTCLHLLCALIPFPVTGGSVRAGSGRLDFDIPQPILDKDELTAQLNELVARNAPVSFQFIGEDELRARPELVRTLEVGPPARNGKVRLVHIEGIDLQPCGGSHLRATGEIGRVRVAKMEKKGRQNRRVEIAIEDLP